MCLCLASNGKKKSEKTYGSSANPSAYILGVSVYKIVVDGQLKNLNRLNHG